MSGPWRKITLTWHTVKHLKFIQWRHRLKHVLIDACQRKFPHLVRQRLLKKVPVAPVCTSAPTPVAWFRKTCDGSRGMFCSGELLEGRFQFLHQAKQFTGPPAWRNPELSYLWNFNLHYFEYLHCLTEAMDDAESSKAERAEKLIAQLIEDWIARNPCPAQPAWHPYPLSLRIVNWIKLFTNRPALASEEAKRSLYAQLLFLERRLEYRLLANHLLENGRALLFGGLFFEGRDAQRWLAQGERILKREIAEEYLPGGGHFERSPMYHCILLEGLLDADAALVAGGRDAAWLKEPLRKMCSWLEALVCPDGSFPLFNDAALGISAMPVEILANAERMIGYRRQESLPAIRDCDHFFVFDSAPFFCVVDGAPIGPAYNPGHAHADNFTYELFFKGLRFVADAGTYQYEADDSRRYFRSTASHNTVVVNGLDQSEVWGGFRVARRSNPQLARAAQDGALLAFQGVYRNRSAPAEKIVHERIIVLHPARWMLIWDAIQARDAIEAESYCHFAPGWRIVQGDGVFRVEHAELGIVHCYPLRVERAELGQSQHAPEFGKLLTRQRLCLKAQGRGRLEMGYLFTETPFAACPDVAVKQQGEALEVRVADNAFTIRFEDAGA